MAKAVEEAAKKTPGKKSLAMDAFARALRAIPGIISDNAGLDSADLVSQLVAAHYNGQSTAGIDIASGTVITPTDILESFKCKSSVVNYAAEAAEMLLRVDDIIHCAKREGNRH
eukprot:NODE_2879_length_396_cov_101.613833_g2797_i0.p1 GENE.NODE_2879_length_396_cov_101.613833_g2797_i0~~NODE_2879_length_396_cov_101.613833_g2797_i0.p1  ORF type:complete len:129 (+),score=37.33 NODE_2879_length_396_cov_101.613833_g2797_i0:47-388(+)